MQQQTSIVTLDDFLKRSMSSETEAGFSEFLNLWQSSESLRALIKRAVQNIELEPESRDRESIAEKQNGPISQNSNSRSEAVLNLIDRGSISLPGIERELSQKHGSLTRKELLVLLEKHKAGKRDLGVYLLVRAWKKCSANSSLPPDIRLKQLTLHYFKLAVHENKADFFDGIADTIRFLEGEEYEDRGHWQHDPGHWWQFHLLLYILEHPKNKYTIREFARFFQDEVGTNDMPTAKTIRKFCRSNGIQLDSTPGAPRKY